MMFLQLPIGPELLVVLLMLGVFGGGVGVAVLVAVYLLRREGDPAEKTAERREEDRKEE
ncbi:MAG: hypothetical protein V5A46_06180 [Haloferacaceae archaeon]